MTEAVAEAVETRQYISFFLAGEEYGIPIMRVQEIIRYEQLTRVPHSTECMKGVLNLRGKVIPVIDLRLKFELEENPPGRNTRIIVVEAAGQVTGLVVDEVREVCNIDETDMEPPPPLGTRIRSEFLAAMAKTEGRLMILLDIDQLLKGEEQVVA